MRKTSTITLLSLGLLLATIVIAFIYWNSVEKSAQTDQHAALVEQGIVLYKQKKYGEVLQVLEPIPENSISDWRIPYYSGAAHMMLNDYAKAATSLEQALALNNQETGVLYALGVVYYKQGNIKLAKSYFASVLEINPADEQAKGLMDIMANLEREADEPKPETEPDQ
jgi:tetratricopeptide (TPR) repeat protein